MKSSVIAAIAACATGAFAQAGNQMVAYGYGTPVSNVTMTTVIQTALTTFCPEATQFEQNGKIYTVTEATTLTILDCPCTQVVPVPVIPTTPTPVVPAPMQQPTNPAANAPYYPPSVGTGTPVNPYKPATFTGAASSNGLSVAGLVGAAALVFAL